MNRRVAQSVSVTLLLLGTANLVLGFAGESLVHLLFCTPPAGIVSNCYLEDLVWGPVTLSCYLVGGLLLVKHSRLGR